MLQFRLNSKLPSIILLIVLALSLAACRPAATQSWQLSGPSMEPNFHDGQIVQVEPVKLPDLKRGDVVLCHLTNSNTFIKRLIGLPGENIDIRQGSIYINGQPLSEPYATISFASDIPIQRLKPDEYFVVGDNRSSSLDSRNVGPIPGENIIGRVVP